MDLLVVVYVSPVILHTTYYIQNIRKKKTQYMYIVHRY